MEQDQKLLKSTFSQIYFFACHDQNFNSGDWALGSVLPQFWDFPCIS